METFKTLRTPFLFFLFFIQISTCFYQSLSFTPADNYLIHCGSFENIEIDDRVFVSDSSGSGLNFLSAARTISLKDQNPVQHSSPLYHTSRVFTKPSDYKFEIKEKGTHLVRLHFLPFISSKFNHSNSLFHVSVDGFLLLSNFTGQNENRNIRNPIIKEYLIWVDSDKLVLSFLPSNESSFSFVNAIEVISAPTELISGTAKYVTNEGTENVDGLTKQAFETIYRINVGGHKVTPFNDTLWRTWITDNGFLKSGSDSTAISFTGRIKYQNGGATREVAPDNVYNSARVLSNSDENITWIFPVKLGYKYLVRIHFCDIASMALNELYFNVYINGYIAYKDLDLSELSGQTLASPYYADFIVDVDSSGDLIISIGPSSMSSPGRINAILNGIEIMKMNNSLGSLDGELSVDSVLVGRSRGFIGILVPSCVVASMLLAAFVLHRRRTQVHDYMGWSPLPVDIPEDK